ncbi:hypothetical protein C2E23DRAFT_730680 [Lenzites betulinus]|nr:hypothetical protein C2E23DRAFT_730680 [Lenzites betulinus]
MSAEVEVPDDAAPAHSSDVDSASENPVADGVAAVVARVAKVGTSGRKKVTAAEKRARFQERFGDMSSEDILAQLTGAWRSTVYEHFKPPVVLPAKADGTVMFRFVCKRYAHPSKHVDRADYEDSTGNLKRHMSGCDPDDIPEVELITAYAQGASYSAARMRFYIAMWCARHHRPFVVVEDPEFRQLLKMLYAKAEIPKRMTVARDVRLIHTDCKERVTVYLKVNIQSRTDQSVVY